MSAQGPSSTQPALSTDVVLSVMSAMDRASRNASLSSLNLLNDGETDELKMPAESIAVPYAVPDQSMIEPKQPGDDVLDQPNVAVNRVDNVRNNVRFETVVFQSDDNDVEVSSQAAPAFSQPANNIGWSLSV